MEPKNAKNNGFLKSLVEWVKVIAIAMLISMPIRFLVAEPFIVNGASMDPTFSTGQFLIVDRLTYRFDEPKRGDVIVFEYPNNPDTYFIKRIIGLPGETLGIRNGTVTISGRGDCAPDSTCPDLVLSEPYVGASHVSRDTLDARLGETEYFVMGDNRAQSSDSRIWGPLDRHFIIGRPIVRLFPLNTISLLPGKYGQGRE